MNRIDDLEQDMIKVFHEIIDLRKELNEILKRQNEQQEMINNLGEKVLNSLMRELKDKINAKN